MVTQPPSEIPDAAVQQSIIQQAQAAAAAQRDTDDTSTARVASTELEQTDLVTPDTSDDVPPPAYSDIYSYGEIRNEKDGMGTSATVTDDGRVNIRVNQLNRRLSQIFTPALRQHIEGVQDSQPPPSAYIPPSLGGKEGVLPPPSLNVVIQVVGSRGDVQPFVALGKVLKNTYGHRVRLATHPTFKDFVLENGLEFFSIGGDPSQLMAFMVKNPGLMPGFRSLLDGDVGQRRRDVAEYIQGCWRSCFKAGDGMKTELAEPAARPFVADCIIANPPSFAHIHCAEKLGIPLHIMFTMPYSPTQAFPHPLANIQSSNADPQLTNYISYAMIEVLAWQGIGDIINRFRKKCLGLDPVGSIWAPGMLQRNKVPHTYCWSPALIPKPKDWGHEISISGFYFLDLASDYTPASDLQEFLNAGPPPVYIGFGSIVLDDPDGMTELIFEAVRKTGQRVLLSKGWGGIGADELGDRVPDGVFMLGNVPHDWLFKHVSCVVHHGGAGTTAAGITAGRPTLVVPFFGDQPFWGAMVARAGAGPSPIPHKQLTSDKLADAINFCLKAESLERARELASKIAEERGSDTGAQFFHQYLEPDRLRCILAPCRPATWRIRRTQIRLSAFAACTLANENLLDFHDLKLFRPQEYYIDEGPLDPLSGGFISLCRSFSGMAMGVVDFPSETLKAVQIPPGLSRQKSQASVLTEKGNTSLETSEGAPGRPTRVQSLPNFSDPSSNLGPRSMTAFRSLDEPGSEKDQNMLRQSGAHTTKGLGRIVRTAVQAPMDVSVSITKGFHNLPKLWGDDTVRPQEKINDFKSGVRAVGKEFGYGMYDGFTGLVTQPWKGAQKDGASGFIKGFGKGIGGFATKPNAALMGVLGHSMKGVHKEVQKLFGNNVQSYIVASRAAQGYEEWLQSSAAEKEDVISQWKTIQKYLKKKHTTDEMVRDVLDAQRKKKAVDNLNQPAEHAGIATNDSRSSDPEESLGAAEINGTIQVLVHETSRGNVEEDASVERAIQENVSELHRQRQAAADQYTDQKNLDHAMASSEAEARRQATETLEYEEQLKQVIAQSLLEQRHRGSDGDWEEVNEALDHTADMSDMVVQPAAVASSSADDPEPPSYDQGHVAGTTQYEFEVQQRDQQGEKTAQEKTEEEIVLEYVKKQSLLEAQHRNKGKGRAMNADEEDDEDLQKALKLSMQ